MNLLRHPGHTQPLFAPWPAFEDALRSAFRREIEWLRWLRRRTRKSPGLRLELASIGFFATLIALTFVV